jgi:FkbM family methyltransferase
LPVFSKLKRLIDYLETPGAIEARIHGCWLNSYSTLYSLRRMGVAPMTVIDIGASIGMFSRCARYVFPRAKIYSFEPLRDCYLQLEKVCRASHDMECYNVAVGERRMHTSINKSEYHYSSSLLPMAELHREAFPYTAAADPEEVSVDRLDDLIDVAKLAEPVLMKIDVQGYEAHVIAGASKTLSRTAHLVCELSLRPLYSDQPLFDDIYSLLRGKGFVFAGVLGSLDHPITSERLQIDGYFRRSVLANEP